MVPHSRTPIPTAQLRPLNTPGAVQVETGPEGEPRAVVLQKGKRPRRRLCVASVRDHWRIDDEWWRRPISRRYYQVVLEDGACLTLFQDLLSGQWLQQR